jgi:periplasmic protein TonB
MKAEDQEKQNKRIAAITTVAVNALVCFLLFLIVAWRAPDPPLPEYGIELNFGMDSEGFGDVQPTTPVGTPTPKNETPEEKVKEVAETSPPVTETKTEQVVTEEESPVAIKEEKKPDPKPVEKTPEKPKEKPAEKEQPKPDPKAVYKPNATDKPAGTSTNSGEGREGKPGNHGDNPGTTGDKGNPQGSLDSKALYGKPGGGGGGSSLEIAGWVWDHIPKPNVPNNESGRIVFEIKVNDEGELIHIKTLERSVSPEAERICRAELQRLSFSKTGTNVPLLSTGKITFVITSK